MRRFFERMGRLIRNETIEHETIVVAKCGFSVSMHDFGERSPGAHDIRFHTSEPLEGLSQFRTTNGTGFYDLALDRVFLYDSGLILEIDPHSGQCRHKNAHNPWGFQTFERRGDRLHFAYFCEGGETSQEEVPYEAIFWHAGLGFASIGKFPSAPITFNRSK